MEIFAEEAERKGDKIRGGRPSKPYASAQVVPLMKPGRFVKRYAKYGWPIHFTEVTVINGRCTKDVDYTIGNPNFWISRPEDLEIQREYTEQLYTLFSAILRWKLLPGGFPRPAVDGCTWWTDNRRFKNQAGI